MGLLAKTNPEATTASVICWALGGAIFAPIGLLLLRIPLPTYLMVAVAFLGAGIGALVEWQLDDGIDPRKMCPPRRLPLTDSGTGRSTRVNR